MKKLITICFLFLITINGFAQCTEAKDAEMGVLMARKQTVSV